MARVARRVHDKRVLRLIRRYLEAGVMEGALVHASEEGTPQGSLLSPLLSNVMLDDLDWELEWARAQLRALRRRRTDLRLKSAGGRAGWRIACSPILATALPNGYWASLGLQGFTEPYRRFRDAKRTARCGPARRVVWGASG